MSDIAIGVYEVWKRFKRGEVYDSFRDLIPALTGRMFGGDRGDQREFWALRELSFEVSRGEAFGIIGANGAGKSTLLKLLSGIMEPTQGSIGIHGSLSALIEVSAGFHPDLTGRENIFLNGTILGLSRAEILARFDEIVEFSGLEDFLDTPVKRYSSGMFARLGFSVAAHVSPDILVVDEVLSVGDYLFQQKCMNRMSEIRSSGTTVVFVSHNLHAVVGLCDRALLLERGQAVSCGKTDVIVGEYLGRAQEQRSDESTSVGIRDVVLRSGSGPASRFEAGETAFLDVTIDALDACGDLAVVIEVVDEGFFEIFDTGTARLLGTTTSLQAGESLECTFDLRLHLGAGTYHVNVYAHQYSANRPFCTWRSAITFFIGDTATVKGRAHLAPSLPKCRIVRDDRIIDLVGGSGQAQALPEPK